MRIKEEDLQSHVTSVLMSIKHGVEAARAQGLIAELPEKVDFEVEVITAVQSLNSATTSNDAETSDSAETRGIGTMIRTEAGVVEVQIEDARQIVATETSGTNQKTAINSKEIGGDITVVSTTY